MLEPVFRELLEQSGVEIENLDRDDEGLFATGRFDGTSRLLENRLGDALELSCEESDNSPIRVTARPPDPD